MRTQPSLGLCRTGMNQSKPSYLSHVPAVSLIESPSAAVIAVGDVVSDNILGLEELFGSLSGHLADYHWPLKVNLWKKVMMNNTHAHAHIHTRVPESSWSRPLCSMHCIYPDCLVWPDVAPSILQIQMYSFQYFVVVFRDGVTQTRLYSKKKAMNI